MPIRGEPALCPNFDCLRVADFLLLSFAGGCREANAFLADAARRGSRSEPMPS
jgi:hypothetical protein